MRHMSVIPTRLVVVVPAHNERWFLPRCLASLERARRGVPVSVQVVVVLDACTDTSRSFVGPADQVIAVNCGNVGAARAAGFTSVGREYRGETWFATTDADCVVPETWLCRQLEHARAGARAVCGTVSVSDWSKLGSAVRTRYEASYVARDGHRHIHGANLGVAAPDYWAVGGFAALAAGEDVDLVHRLQQAQVPIRWVADMPVDTSARLHGRARGGFADHLRFLHGSTRHEAIDTAAELRTQP